MKGTNSLNFVNSIFQSQMLIEENESNTVGERTKVNFSKTNPTAIQNPYIGALSHSCAELVGLDTSAIWDEAGQKDSAAI